MDIGQSQDPFISISYKADMPSLVYELLDQFSDSKDVSKISNFQNRDYIKKTFNSEIYNIPRNVREYISKFSHTITRYDKLSFTQFAIKYFDHYESQGAEYISPENALKIFKVLCAHVFPDNVCLDAERVISALDQNFHEKFLPLISEGYAEMAPTIEMLFKLKVIKSTDLTDSPSNFVEQCSDYLINSLMLTNSQSEVTYNNSLSCAVYLATRLPGSFGECLLQKTKDWAPNDDIYGFPKIRSITEERTIFARRMIELSEITPRSSLKLNIQMGSNSEYCSLENILMSLVMAHANKYKLEELETSIEAIPSEESLLKESILRHSSALPSQTLMKLLMWEGSEQGADPVLGDLTEGIVTGLFKQNFNELDKYKIIQIIQSPCSIRRKLLILKMYVKKMNGEESVESILNEAIVKSDITALPSLTDISLSLISESREYAGLFVHLVQKGNTFLMSLRSSLTINPSEVITNPSTQSISRLIRFIKSKLSSESGENTKSIKCEYVSLIEKSEFLDLMENVAAFPIKNELNNIGEIFIESFKLAHAHEPLVQNKIVEILFNMASHPTENGRRALNFINNISFSNYAEQKNNILRESIFHSLKDFSLIVQESDDAKKDENTSLHVRMWLETLSFLMTSGRAVSNAINCPQILNGILALRQYSSIESTDQIEKYIERIEHSSYDVSKWYEDAICECCDRFMYAGDAYGAKMWFSRLTSFIALNKKNPNIYSYITDGLNQTICEIVQDQDNKNLQLVSAKVQFLLSHLHDNKSFMSHFHESELSETIRNMILPIASSDGNKFYEAYDIIPWSIIYFKIE